MRGSQIHLGRLGLVASVFLLGIGCPYPEGDGQNDVPEPDLEITEVEPNDEVSTAQATGLADVASVRLLGTITGEDDIDLYELGPLSAGDRITVDVNTSQTQLDATAVIFDTDSERMLGTLFATNDNASDAASNIDPFIDEVIRHDADHYFLGVAGTFGTLLSQGDYEATIRVARGGATPSPQRQTFLLDFDGGSDTTSAGYTIAITPFDAALIDAVYAGHTQVIKDVIVATVEENFAGFHVDILNTDEDAPPSEGPFSTVFIGQVVTAGVVVGSEGLGVALDGTDAYNKNPADNAVVFVENFTPATFGLAEPISPQELGVAIGNVASHEAGHLLGLNHVFDPASLMNTFDAPATLLLDQRFKLSLITFSVFDSLSNLLRQDARLLLQETVGRVAMVAHATAVVGNTPLWITAGDLDGDGDADLAVANRFDETISVLLNDGDAALAPAVNLDIGVGSTSVITLDADGDGDLDLLAANPSAHILTLLLNDGNAGFTVAPALTAGDRPVGPAAADFDGDGDADLAVANFESGDVSILLNNGSGGFLSAATHPVGGAPQNVTVADLNADAAPDVVTSNAESNDVSVLLNNGDGTFADAVSVGVGSLPGISTAADLDGDGDIDLAVADRLASLFAVQAISNVSVLINNGDGTFAAPAEYFVGASAEAVTSADLDGDGDVDLAVACSGDLLVPQDTGQLSILLNKGDGTFAQDVAYEAGQGPISVTAADLDVDGDADLVVANRDSGDVSAFLNAGNGSLGIPVEVGGQ